MGTLSRHRPPTDRPTVLQAVHDLHAQSPAFCDAVVSDPFEGPEGAVVLDVKIGQETALRVVAPTEDEAYALLRELVESILDTARRSRGMPAQTCGPIRPSALPPAGCHSQGVATSLAPPASPPSSATCE